MTTPNTSNPTSGVDPVNLAEKAVSSRFKDLYAEGMALVEEVASYLDGPGRQEAKLLANPLATAYAAESMRLTTRLMQVASWLLVQKAIFDGDLNKADGATDQNRVQLSTRGIASQAAVFAALPEGLQELTARSIRVQARIIQFEARLRPSATEVPVVPSGLGIHGQFDLLRRSFGSAPH